MPKIDDTIKKAIAKASKAQGSQAQLARSVGITPPALSRYINGQIERINASTWNMIFPFIKEYLPENYHRTFLSWKSKEEWDKLAQEGPEIYNFIASEAENVDLKKIAKTDPLYCREMEFVNTVKLLTQKIPYLSQKTLNKFLIEAIKEIESTEK